MKVRYRHLKGRSAPASAAAVHNRAPGDPSGTFALRQRFSQEMRQVFNTLRLAANELSFNYDPSQPRDRDGRWASAGTGAPPSGSDGASHHPAWREAEQHGVSLFHGTKDSALESILRHGLDVRYKSAGADRWAKDNGLADFAKYDALLPGRKASIYLTNDRQAAAQMATAAAAVTHSRPVVLTVDIPQNQLRHLHSDELFHAANPLQQAVRFEGRIPPNWIKHAEFVSSTPLPTIGHQTIRVANEGEPVHRFYVVLLVADPRDAVPTSNYDPGQLRDEHAGGTRTDRSGNPGSAANLGSQAPLDLTANAAQSCLSPQLWGRHLHVAYQQGVLHAFNEVHRALQAQASNPEGALIYHGARQQFVANTLQLHELPALRRVFREYEQRSRQVLNRLQSRLATAATGLDVNKALHGAGNQLATLSRLGVVRAHAEGQLDGYQSLGIGRVKLSADAGGCRYLHNTIHTIDQARGTIPRHGVCRCAWLPAANAIPFPLVNRAQGSLDAFSALLANYSPEQPRDERGRWTQEMSGEYTHAKPHYETRDSQDPTLQREEWDKIGSRLPPGERRSEWTSRGDNHPVGSRRVDSSPLVKFESEAPESTRSTGHGSVAPAASSSADSSSSATGVRDASTEKIRTGDVETKRLLGGGCNGSYHVYLDNGEEGAWKPRDEEDNNLRMGIPEKTQYKREAAAYAVAEAIGMQDLVCPTTIREIDGEVGSIQQWQGNSRVAARVNESEKYDGEADLKRAAIFDYLVGNSDRHQGNWMINNDGKLRLIDHGLILPTNNRDDYVNQQILEQAQLHRDYTDGKMQVGYRIPQDVVHLKDKWPAIEQALQKCGIEPAAIDMTHNRLIDLTEAAARGESFQDLPPIFGGRLGGRSSTDSRVSTWYDESGNSHHHDAADPRRYPPPSSFA